MKPLLLGIVMAMLFSVPILLFGGIAARLRQSGRALASNIAWMTRAAACSLIVGLVAAVFADYAAMYTAEAGVLAGLFSLPVTLLVTRPMRSPGEARSLAPVTPKEKAVRYEKSDPTLPTPTETPRWSWLRRRAHSGVADEALEAAWLVAESLADWAPSRLAAIRTSCAALLREADLAPLNMEAKELVILIRRRIPELISACANECRHATRSERESLVEDLLDSLESVGAEADRRRKQARRSRGTQFDILRAHLGNRVKKEGWL